MEAPERGGAQRRRSQALRRGGEPELRLRGALAEAAGRFADAAVELYRSRSDAARERRAALGSEALAALHRDSAFVESAATLRGEL